GTFGSGNAADVVVYNYGFMTGTNARSMAHEFGHWLDLPHTFGNTNTPGTCLSGGQSDDFLSTHAPAVACTGVTDDTPKYAGAFSTCPPGTPNSCDVSNHANVQNIMDYSSCPLNFTNGQIKRMHNMMNSTTVGRNNVTSAANKIATGVRNPQVCIPNANFHVSARIACPTTILTFSDSSENAHATSWHWNFPGGTLQGGSTVTDSMPKVSYAAAGTYAVSYTASTTAGSNSISKTSYITIITNVASHNTSFAEGFETAAVPGADWSVTNTMGYDWNVTSTAAATGSKSIMLDNFSNPAGNVSNLISTSFDISGFTTPKLTFKVAYQQVASTNNDKLQVFTSTDCENTWNSRFSRAGATLATVTPPSGFPLTPTPSQFTTYTVNINGVSGSNNVRFRFAFFADPAGPGNDIYLDDINLFDASVGIKTIESQIGLDIYPNPASGNVTIDLNLEERHTISVSVMDVLGRTVESIPAKEYATGETKLGIAEKTTYEAGVYFVNLNVDGNIISKKIIIK
ncbi:MAG TPA: T9SS type A sorting domain-containing protein, partial [Bacteroidia bacterium]|nr:T9SS type A sorting domain-containing protein [Bacteroidia bacterium]